MPLVQYIKHPVFDELLKQGEQVLSLDQAHHQDIRELHIGLLNMMPDTAFKITEQQFVRLVGSSNQIAQFYVHLFTISGLKRSHSMQDYIESYYQTFDSIREEGLDALIITGANISNPILEKEAFWKPLQDVINWAQESVTSVMCSCLATHALMKQLYDIDRQLCPKKRWGVYHHHIKSPNHPLLRNINTRFDVPHSRYNTITKEQLNNSGLKILIESSENDVHMVVSKDQLRFVFLQGHPEYSINSLLKEYKREVNRFIHNERSDYPPYPENYFSDKALDICDRYKQNVFNAIKKELMIPEFPEKEIEATLDNTWGDTGRAIFNNWLGLVYQLTHVDRKKAFIEGLDPENPLGLNQSPYFKENV